LKESPENTSGPEYWSPTLSASQLTALFSVFWHSGHYANSSGYVDLL
jgi:hypothetical protein